MTEPAGADLIRPAGDGWWRIRLGPAGQLVANAWLVQGPDGYALFDTGFPETAPLLVDALLAVGVDPADLCAVVYTHTHADHMGGGVALAGRLGGDSVVWEGTRPATDGWHAWAAALEPWPHWVRTLLAPSSVRDEMVDVVSRTPGASAGLAGGPELARLRTVAFGESIDVAGRSFMCLDGRGHDPYHAMWLEHETGTLVGGDVVLGVPTPIVPPMRDDAEMYRRTLGRLAARTDLVRILPGHGRVHDDPARAIRRAGRYLGRTWDAVVAGLRDGAFDPADAVADLLASGHPIARKQSFVVLATTHGVLLELQARGLVECGDDRRWRATGVVPSWDALDAGPD